MAGGAGRAEPGPPAQPPHGDADGRPERAQGDHHHHRRQVVLLLTVSLGQCGAQTHKF